MVNTLFIIYYSFFLIIYYETLQSKFLDLPNTSVALQRRQRVKRGRSLSSPFFLQGTEFFVSIPGNKGFLVSRLNDAEYVYVMNQCQLGFEVYIFKIQNQTHCFAKQRITLDLLAPDPIKIMLSKGGSLWKLMKLWQVVLTKILF